MAAPKGNKFSPGRTKGSKNEKTRQWEALGESIMTTHAERFNQILDQADDEFFTRNYLQLIEYFKPKMSRQDGELGGEIIHKVIFTRK